MSQAPNPKDALELLPCPFCGSAAEIERDKDHHGEWFNLGCSCHWGNVEPDSACPAGRMWYTADPEYEPKAIATWNTRATLSPPAGERREAIARIICYWDQTGTCHDNYCGGSCRAKKPNAEFFKVADEILASGLVQDEAGWQPIETAPKDGTTILVVENGRVVMVDAVRAMGTPKLRRCGGASHNYFVNDATHWRPLPAPPIRSARDGGAS